jgi:hypothetical protein
MIAPNVLFVNNYFLYSNIFKYIFDYTLYKNNFNYVIVPYILIIILGYKSE